MQIQLTSEITEPYSTTSVINGLFYTSYSFNINITMKYTLDYATCMPTKEKINKPWNNFHGIGLIFHVTRIGGNFRVIGRAKRAPPLGCSIEISRDIYLCVCSMSN